jgi:hypothetical protein
VLNKSIDSNKQNISLNIYDTTYKKDKFVEIKIKKDIKTIKTKDIIKTNENISDLNLNLKDKIKT